jgi:hypothetical protein
VDKSTLEQLLSSYNWWMGVSTVAVAIGILGEYVAHFIFEEEARRNKREMAVSILFGVLVLGGVVGEYIFGKKLSQVSEQLQQIADTEVAQSNRDAATARKDAELTRQQSAATYERAAKAEQEANQENERAAKALKAAELARKNAEGFHLQIAQANERAAQSNKIAEQERVARLQLEARLAPRFLTPAQQQDLTASLKQLGLHNLDILLLGDTPEIRYIADLLKSAIENAGWNVRIWRVTLGGVVTGVVVAPLENSGNEQLAGTLASLIYAEGIAASPYPPVPRDKWGARFIGSIVSGDKAWDDNKAAPIRMYIGTKP